MTDNQDIQSPETREDHGQERRDYVLGYGLALALTLAAFAIVVFDVASRGTALLAIAALGVVQLIVQFRYFLHIDLQKSHRDDLQLILFTGLLGIIMVGGTIWIIFNQMKLMG